MYKCPHDIIARAKSHISGALGATTQKFRMLRALVVRAPAESERTLHLHVIEAGSVHRQFSRESETVRMWLAGPVVCCCTRAVRQYRELNVRGARYVVAPAACSMIPALTNRAGGLAALPLQCKGQIDVPFVSLFRRLAQFIFELIPKDLSSWRGRLCCRRPVWNNWRGALARACALGSARGCYFSEVTIPIYLVCLTTQPNS